MPPGNPPAAALKLHEGATQLGWKSLEAPRWLKFEPGAAAGRRQSMTETYIPRFLKAGGRLLPGARVNRLQATGNGWSIEAAHHSAGKISVHAGAVFLCAGAVHTPALLRRSGLGRHIGDSLQVHPTLKIVARFHDAINSPGLGVAAHQVKEFSPRLGFGCSVSSPAHLALGLSPYPAATGELACAWRNLAIYYAMITSEGRGTVRTVPGFRDPVVRYALTANDRANLADGLRKLAQVLFESGAATLYPGVNDGPPLLRRGDRPACRTFWRMARRT